MKTIVSSLLFACLVCVFEAHASDTEPWTPAPTLDLRVQPSPARGECTISWAPSGFAPVRIMIRDAAGHVVRKLDGGTNVASVRWDGRDERGRVARPGVYFVRLTAVDLEKHARLVLLR